MMLYTSHFMAMLCSSYITYFKDIVVLLRMCIGQGFVFFCKLPKYFLTFIGLENSRWSYLCSYQPVKYKQPLAHVQRNDHKWIQKHFLLLKAM